MLHGAFRSGSELEFFGKQRLIFSPSLPEGDAVVVDWLTACTEKRAPVTSKIGNCMTLSTFYFYSDDVQPLGNI